MIPHSPFLLDRVRMFYNIPPWTTSLKTPSENPFVNYIAHVASLKTLCEKPK